MNTPNQLLQDGEMPLNDLIELLHQVRKIDPDCKAKINRNMLYFRTEHYALRGSGGIYLDREKLDEQEAKVLAYAAK